MKDMSITIENPVVESFNSDRQSLTAQAVKTLIKQTEAKINYYTIRQDIFDPLMFDLEDAIDVITVNLTSSEIDIHVAGDKKTLNTVFKILRKHGLSPDTRPGDKNTAFTTWFRLHDKKATKIWLNFTSTQCQQVQVGTKMIEQPVYKTVCAT